MDPNASEIIKTNIDDWAPRLAKLAKRRLNLRVLSGRYGGRIPGGLNPADLVQNAIVKTLSGERNWNPTKQPDLFKFLKWAIYSEISSIVKKLENKLSVEPTANYSEEDEESIESRLESEEKDQLKNLEDNDHITNFYIFLESEKELQEVVELSLEDWKRGEVAEKLNKKPTEITNLKKRLKLKYIEFLSSQGAMI